MNGKQLRCAIGIALEVALEAQDENDPEENRQGVVIYGPSGCGKSTHATALAKFLGKSRVVDDWTPGATVGSDTLALTSHPHQGAMDFYIATAIAGINLTPSTVGKRITRSPAKCIECQQPLGHSHLAHCLLIPFVGREYS